MGVGDRGWGRRETKQGWSLLEKSFLAVNPSSNRGREPLPGVAPGACTAVHASPGPPLAPPIRASQAQLLQDSRGSHFREAYSEER